MYIKSIKVKRQVLDFRMVPFVLKDFYNQETGRKTESAVPQSSVSKHESQQWRRLKEEDLKKELRKLCNI